MPFFVSWAGKLPAGKVYDQPVSALDVLPTAEVARLRPDITYTIVELDRVDAATFGRLLRELVAAVARAKFRFITAPTCAAVNDRRVLLEAPRRGKRIATESPCGRPLDPATAALAACAERVAGAADVPLDELRATCRPAR